jgi:hypothetical protein
VRQGTDSSVPHAARALDSRSQRAGGLAGSHGITFNAVGSSVVICKNPTAQKRCRGYPSPPFIQDSTSACTENGRAGLEAKRACN